jgi:hypothetical protein
MFRAYANGNQFNRIAQERFAQRLACRLTRRRRQQTRGRFSSRLESASNSAYFPHGGGFL